MSDPKRGHHAHHRARFSSAKPLEYWENEGGSLYCPSAVEQAESGVRAGYPVPEFSLLDAVPLGILITNDDGEIIYSNPASERLYSTPASKLLGTHWRQVIDARDRSAVPARWHERNGWDAPLTFEVRIITGSGQRLWTRHSVALMVLDRVRRGHIHTIEDISRVKSAEKVGMAALDDLSKERERARVTLECIGDAVISTDAEGRVTYLNTVAEHLTGWSREHASGQLLDQVFRVVDADSGQSIHNPAERAMESLDVVQMPPNSLLLRPDGSELAVEDSAAPILDKDGRLTGAVVIFRDRRLSRENTARMAHLARHDALTGLPNRVAFSERFDQAIKLARRHQNRVALLFIDLDQFKLLNDSLGHKAGDRLLRSVSRKLAACVRNTDLVCRYGGDEFVVLLGEIGRPEDAGRVAAKIQAASAKLRLPQGRALGLALSIGISLYPDDGSDLETLMHRADTAMYHAKLDSGRDYHFYRAGLKRPRASSHIGNTNNAMQRTVGKKPMC